MAIIEKEVLLKAIYDPSFAKGAFTELPVTAFSEKEEYKEVFNTIKEHYMLKGDPLTERVLLNKVEERLLKRKVNDDKIGQHIESVHDLYTIERAESDDEVVDARINEFVRSKLVFKAMQNFLTSGAEFGDEKELNKLVPQLQRITTMNVSGESGTLVDFFADTELKKEKYRQLEGAKFSTGFQAIDKASAGGLGRGEVGMILGATGSGKCVTGDTLVYTDKGLIPIQEIPGYYKVHKETGESQAQVASYNSKGAYTPRKTSHWFNMGYSKTIKITTKRGFVIEGTPEHPLLVLNRAGDLEYIKLKDMVHGDYISLATPNMWSSKDKIDPETAYMMGVTDGLSPTNTQKGIFNLILRSTKHTVLRYLQGIIDMTGIINDRFELDLFITEDNIAKQLQIVLANLDVMTARTRLGEATILTIRGVELLNLFHELETTQTDLSVILSAKQKISLGKLEVEAHNVPLSDTRPVPYQEERMKRIKEDLTDNESFDYLVNLHSNFVFDPIVRFETSHAEVYDFTVPETHSFVANGIVSHNTTWAVQQLNNYTKKGMNTLYIALEENLGRMLLKIEQNMLGVPKTALFDESGELREDIFDGAQELYKEQMNLGRMFISKHQPQEVTISDIEQVILDIKFRKGVDIDAVILDYPDLMKNPHFSKGASESDAGGKLLEDVRALAGRHNYICWVLGQLNRQGWGQELRTAESIEGSKRKLNAVEMCFTLNQNSDEFEQGLLRIHLDKLRYAADGGFNRVQYFKLDRDGLRIRDESPEEIENHKALIGESSSSAPTRPEVNNNKQVMDKIKNINNSIGGK